MISVLLSGSCKAVAGGLSSVICGLWGQLCVSCGENVVFIRDFVLNLWFE